MPKVTEEIIEKVDGGATSPNAATAATPSFEEAVGDALDADLDQIDETYGGMMSEAEGVFGQQMEGVDQWEQAQKDAQQAETDFAISEIERQKSEAEKDYKREQAGSYQDWQRQKSAYGVNAEQMAAAGLTGSGYSESSQVAMYTQHQNRVATAREAFVGAVADYEVAITQARLQNNSALAQIALEAFQSRLELSVQHMQHKNALLAEMTAMKTAAEDRHWGRYQDILAQMNYEKSFAESVRQYEEDKAYRDKVYEDQKAEGGKLTIDKQSAAETERKEANKEVMDALHAQNPGFIGSIPVSGAASPSGNQTTQTPSKDTTSNTEYPIDMQSLVALGYSPTLTGEDIAQLELNGWIESYVEDGKLKFRKTWGSKQLGNWGKLE